MKKIIALLLACMMLIACTACAAKTEPAAPAEETAAEPAPAAEAPAAEEEATEEAPAAEEAAASDSDLAYIQANGKLVVGITDFAPMDYQDENGEWIGFDADMAKAFAKSLGVEAEFVEIDWDNKIMELGRQDHRLRLERHDPHRRSHQLPWPARTHTATTLRSSWFRPTRRRITRASTLAAASTSQLNPAPPAWLRSKSWATASPRSRIRPPRLMEVAAGTADAASHRLSDGGRNGRRRHRL